MDLYHQATVVDGDHGIQLHRILFSLQLDLADGQVLPFNFLRTQFVEPWPPQTLTEFVLPPQT